MANRLSLDKSDGRPSWYGTVASYVRNFQRDRHGATSELMPIDRRISIAVRKVYRTASPAERAVMDGTSELSGRGKSPVFNRICYLIAREARLTAAVILPPEYEETEETRGEPEQHEQT